MTTRMALLTRIRPLYLIVAFFLGMVYVHFSTPTPSVVLKFPSPYNAGAVLYRDNSDTCYRYQAQKVECDKDAQPQPIVESWNSCNPCNPHDRTPGP